VHVYSDAHNVQEATFLLLLDVAHVAVQQDRRLAAIEHTLATQDTSAQTEQLVNAAYADALRRGQIFAADAAAFVARHAAKYPGANAKAALSAVRDKVRHFREHVAEEIKEATQLAAGRWVRAFVRSCADVRRVPASLTHPTDARQAGRSSAAVQQHIAARVE